MAKSKKPRLGRGLSSLLSQPVVVDPPSTEDAETAAPEEASIHSTEPKQPSTSGLTWIHVEQIHANPYQPRRHFDDAALTQLAQSIKQDGVMQPVVLRPNPMGTGYQLVAGERRWRASQIAQLDQIPAVVRSMDDQQMAEWAVIENLQREDLNTIERALAFSRLADAFSMSHQQIAERIGLERSTVTNLMRLLELHPDIQEMIRIGKLSGGHGRALLGLEDAEAQLMMAKQAVAGGWSVRKIEQTVRLASKGAPRGTVRSQHASDLAQQIASQLGTKVKIKQGRKKGTGTLSIDFYSLDHFDDILSKLEVRVE